MLVLASRSPRRAGLLRAAGIPFRVVAPLFEDGIPAGRPGRYADAVRSAALQKALDVAQRVSGPILAADTIVVCGGRFLGKPADEADAARMLRLLSGRSHAVYSGIALVSGGRRALAYERTTVAFRRLSDEQIAWYVHSGEPMDKAGAYAIQGKGAALIRVIRGCYTNVIGLPLPKSLEMLAEFGITPAAVGGARG